MLTTSSVNTTSPRDEFGSDFERHQPAHERGIERGLNHLCSKEAFDLIGSI